MIGAPDSGGCDSLSRMSKYDSSFVSAVEGRKRQICVDLLRQNLDLTLSDIHQLAKGELGKLLTTITISDLLHPGQAQQPRRDVAPKAPAKGKPGAAAKVAKSPVEAKQKGEGKAKAKAKPAPVEAAASAEVNTRTPAGRAAFDKAVFDAIKASGGSVGAGVIQKRVGGTNMQVRSACNRLIEAGQLSWSGKARGTRYSVA